MKTHGTRVLNATSLLPVVALLSGCEFVGGFLGASAEDDLVDAALDAWVTPGATFLEARFSRDTIGTVNPTGEWSWEVTLPDEGSQPYAFEVSRVEVMRVAQGDAFVQWLETTARGLGMRQFLPGDAKAAVSGGSIVAIGDFEVAFGRSDRRGRTRLERTALLRSGSGGESWSIEPEGNRTARMLRDALRLVYADMIARDERVHACMGSVDARSVARSDQLACVGDVLAAEFGES